jgi:hypothetical protein
MKNFLKIVSVYVGAFFFFLAQRACVAYILLLFKYAFICIPNTGSHIRIMNNIRMLTESLMKTAINIY